MRGVSDPLNGPGVPARFRTIQVRSKDLAVALRQRVVCEFIVVMLGGRMPVAAIRRREFLTLLGGAAAGCPLTGRAQQIGKLPTIGFLGPNARPAASEWVAALVQRLGELGWIEGRNITIAYRWAEGIDERFAEIAAEFVRLKVDVIVTSGTPAVMALRQATSVIPIVFATAGDPVGNNLVASLARPGANITGLATLAADLAGKRLEILREVVPGLGRLAIMGNAANPFTVLEMGEVKTAARTLGLEVAILEIRRAQDIAATFDALKGHADALYVCTDGFASTNRVRINVVALGAQVPTMHGSRDYVEAGGLMSFGPNFPDLFRRSADYVDKILHGSKPANIPVEQPTKFDLIVNLVTAKALGLTIPPTLLARTDEVIE
jgi:putative ABC transport system substrate-binding protein